MHTIHANMQCNVSIRENRHQNAHFGAGVCQLITAPEFETVAAEAAMQAACYILIFRPRDAVPARFNKCRWQ